MHGGVAKEDLGKENVEAVKKGAANLARHIQNVKKFGVQIVVALNRFIADTDAEIKAIRELCSGLGVDAYECNHWAEGGAGTEDLAKAVVALCDKPNNFSPLYPDEMPLWEKVKTIATSLYGAQDIIGDKTVRDRFHEFEKMGFGKYPVCMAKTQYSFSTDPNLKGAPSNHVVPIREIRLSAGAEFIVVICGEVMTMPGLPRVPSANHIKLNEKGEVEGLF